MVKCEICGLEYKSNASLARHISAKHHETSIKEYYDLYIKGEKYCKVCGEETTFQSFSKGYRTYCSRKCSYKDKDVSKKRSNTVKEKYGVNNVSQLDDIKKSKKETLTNTFGSIENYKNVLKKNMLDNNPMDKEEYRLKLKETLNKEEVKEKIKVNTLYSRRNNFYDKFISLLKLKSINFIGSKEDYINNTVLKFSCENCNKEWEVNHNHPQNIHCSCNRSYKEVELEDWIKSLGIEVESNKRFYYESKKYFEIDIYLPDYDIGLEYNGIYWHSEAKLENDYHQTKKLFFKERDIDLIQVFGDKWNNKQDIVKSIISNRLNLNINKIYARKCVLKEINKNDYEIFLEDNHIQGYVASKYKFGMYYEDELLSVMGIGKSRFNEDSYELIRYGVKNNLTIVGGFSRLLKYFNKNYKINELISYVDLDLFNGNGYKKLGFEEIGYTKPNYSYFKKNKSLELYPRQYFMKHKLKEKLDNFDNTKTEHENMLNNGYLRIYNSGNLKVKLTF